jgi:transposase
MENIKHPQWALAQKKPGTELRLIRGHYYLYEYKTVYDREKKRPRKITGKLIGTITQADGLILSGKRKLEKTLSQTSFSNLSCKEYGVSFMVFQKFSKYGSVLQKIFPDFWQSILAIAYCRFVYRCPLKSVPFRLSQSYLPELFKLKPFNDKTTSYILKTIGGLHDQKLSYMKTFIRKEEYLLMDATNVFSNSMLMPLSKKGYNSHLNYDSQFNLMYLYSAKTNMPVYYRLLPGNIREVKAFKNSLLEAGLDSAVIIADKGFYSQKNIELLAQENLKFILPLKRDNTLINYETLVDNNFKTIDSYFEHEKRIIWYRKFQAKGFSLFLFLDESLRLNEERDYLRRIETHPESYSIQEYHGRRNTFGTIAMLTNLKRKSAVDVFQTYKSRMTIEVLFDGMKNVLEADHTYMQDEQTLQGWMFVNHIILQWYQQLYIELKEKGLLKKISVNDYIQMLTDLKKVKINDSWHFNEITAQSAKMIKSLGISYDKI